MYCTPSTTHPKEFAIQDILKDIIGVIAMLWLIKKKKSYLPLFSSYLNYSLDELFYLYLNSTVQVNLCQKLSFLNQLTHNMTRDCSLNPPKNTSSEHVVFKYICIVLNVETKKHNFCTQHVLN